MKRPRGTGSLFKLAGSQNWFLKYHKNGAPVRESSGTSDKRKAERILQKRIGEVATGTFIEPQDRKVTVDELYAALLADYRANELASYEGAEQRWQRPAKDGEPLPQAGRLKAFFGGMRALAVTTDRLNRYVAQCREQELANATINRDLSALRRAFNLAERAGKIQRTPHFPRLKESAPRSGFVGDSEYSKLAANAKELWLRGMLATAYRFGFRKHELLALRVGQIDLLNRTIRLNAGETKSGDGRVVKLTGDVYVLLQACVSGKGQDDFVFTRADGKPILDFRERWSQLTAAAGCPGLLVHDLRRSAVRNMVRAGIPEVVCMKISGHKTRSVFDRYNVVSENDLADAALKIEAGNQVWAKFGPSLEKTQRSQESGLASTLEN